MSATLYFTLGSGNSFKPALVLHQTGRHCHREFVNVLAGDSRQAAFLALNPRGQVPFLVTADGRSVGESNAIAWLLAEDSHLMPEDPVHRAQALQWMIFEQTTLEPNISPARFFTHIVPEQRAAHAQDIPRWLEAGHRGLQVLDQHLQDREFITGHGYSVADIAVYGYTHLAGEGGFSLAAYQGLNRWMHRVQATDGYASISDLLRHVPD
jgi:glutathione S-transferase